MNTGIMPLQAYPVQWYWPLAYSFVADSPHTARVRVRNPSAQTLSYSAELYLGKYEGDKAAKATQSFSLAAGEEKDIDFQVTMPSTPVTYHVYLDVYVEGERIAAYMATEDVIVTPPEPKIWVDSYTWIDDPSNYYPGVIRSVSIVLHHEIPSQYVSYEFEVVLMQAGIVKASSDRQSDTLGGWGHDTYTFAIVTPSVGTYDASFRAYISGQPTPVYEYSLGTVTVVPIPGPGFSYSNVSCGTVPKGGAYYWFLFECDIKNTSPQRATQRITLWLYGGPYNYTKSMAGKGPCNGSYGRCPECKDPGEMALTLDPGQTYHYRFCSFNTSTPYIHDYEMWLEDDMGGVSPRCHT